MNNPSYKHILNSLLEDEGFLIARPEGALIYKEIQPIIYHQKQHKPDDILETLSEDKKELQEAIIKEAEDEERSLDESVIEESLIHDEDVHTIIGYLNWHMKRINTHIIGRKDIIEQAFYALLTGEHMLLLSRTGMAKSYLANHIFDSFENVRIFASQASKDQTPDNYFGPYNIEEFKKGRIKHNLHGSIIEANLVFLDEFFDASDVVLRSLLSVLNERKFINGQEQVDCAIHSAIATANYMRLNEVTEAILDRFIYKSIIPEDANSFNKFLIDQNYIRDGGKIRESKRRTPFDKLKYLYDIIKNHNPDVHVLVPDHISYLKNAIIDKYVGEMRKYENEYFISPRRQAKLIDFLRAAALLDNRLEVTTDDLQKMYLPLCTLNSYVAIKAHNKSEKDLFRETYEKTMIHFQTTGSLPQLELLLNIRRIFEEVRNNPDKKEDIQKKSVFIVNVLKIFKDLFKHNNAEQELTLPHLYQTVFNLKPGSQEIEELREGILAHYRDMAS